MHVTLTVCPCCQEVDVEPDYEHELEADEYKEAECYQCRLTDEENQMLFDDAVLPF